MSRAGSLNSTNAEKKASANLLHRFYRELAARRLNPHTFNPALPNHDRKLRSPFQSHTSMRSRNVNSTRKRPKPDLFQKLGCPLQGRLIGCLKVLDHLLDFIAGNCIHVQPERRSLSEKL